MYVSIVILPLIGAMLAGLGGRWLGPKGAGFITTTGLALTCLLALIGFYEVGMNGSPVSLTLGPWMEVEWMDATWGFLFDSLTSSMMVIVTFISTLVHLYSMEYIAQDPHQPRFISYLSLFTFFMILLITAENFVQMFLGWEGVGLCSYLLINFWFTRYAANKAAMKAMVINRVGDFGFSLGIFGVFATFHSVDFAVVFSQVPSYAATHGSTWLTVLCLLLFVGAVGKSAQIGLHTWLPDAMEGPTPVSALIHAATMVTAGVFIMIRCSPLFEYAPSALMVITLFGAITAFFAATTGLLQNDLKKVIAYSTCSQLGYMVFAVGLSQYSISMFHLINHAYFKALLFLSAGSVIHALADEQDIRRMGGLVKLLPFTYTIILVGSLALIGFPFLTGFYSKDVILEVAYAHLSFQGTFAHWLGCLSAFFTAFYSFRLIFITFFRDTQAYRTVLGHVHEAPWKIAVPLGILGGGSIFIGYLTRDLFIGLGTPFWGNALFIHPDHWIQADSEWIPVMIKWVPFWISVGGSALALALYTFGRYFIFQIQLSSFGRNLTTFLAQKWFFDRVYNETLGPWFIKWGYHTSYAVLDKGLIEASGPVGAWNLSSSTGKMFHQFHSGYLYHASFWIIISVSFVFAFLFFPFLQSFFVLPILVILFFSLLFI